MRFELGAISHMSSRFSRPRTVLRRFFLRPPLLLVLIHRCQIRASRKRIFWVLHHTFIFHLIRTQFLFFCIKQFPNLLLSFVLDRNTIILPGFRPDSPMLLQLRAPGLTSKFFSIRVSRCLFFLLLAQSCVSLVNYHLTGYGILILLFHSRRPKIIEFAWVSTWIYPVSLHVQVVIDARARKRLLFMPRSCRPDIRRFLLLVLLVAYRSRIPRADGVGEVYAL